MVSRNFLLGVWDSLRGRGWSKDMIGLYGYVLFVIELFLFLRTYFSYVKLSREKAFFYFFDFEEFIIVYLIFPR